MKYLIQIVIGVPFLIISAIIGSFFYLWGFNKSHFKKGFRWLNRKINVAEFLEKL
jgi:hypothetical protein